jgi:hypothetical protein
VRKSITYIQLTLIKVNAYFTQNIELRGLVMVVNTFGCNTPGNSGVLGCRLREEYEDGHRFSWFSCKHGTKLVVVLAGDRTRRCQFSSFTFHPFGPSDI